MELLTTSVMVYDPGIRDRMVKIFADLNLTVEEIARDSDVPMSTLYNFLSEDRRVKSIKDLHLAAIIKAYPAINANYVLTGQGSALIESITTDELPVVYVIKTGRVRVEVQEKGPE